jgi:hypothetical protein
VSQARSRERASQQFQDVLCAQCASRHRFLHSAEPDIHLLSQAPKSLHRRLSFVFSASPETIRREPREGDLLRSVGNMQDLAVCAFCSSCFFRQYLCCRSPAFFSRCKVSLLPIHGKQISDHLSGYGKCRPIAISSLLFPIVDHG